MVTFCIASKYIKYNLGLSDITSKISREIYSLHDPAPQGSPFLRQNFDQQNILMLSRFFKNVQGSLGQFSQNLKTQFGNSQQNKLVQTNNEILLRQANAILKKLKTSS
jgi:hypothetical protein